MKIHAINKIKSEMEANQEPYIQIVGTYLLGYLEQHDDFTECVMVGNKTIKGSVEAMRKVAEGRKVNQVAVLSDKEGFKIVVDYYCEKPKDVEATEEIEEKEVVDESSVVTNVGGLEDLDDLLDDESPVEVVKEELFTRNAWYHDPDTDTYLVFKKGDVKPEEVINRKYKTATKKQYEEWLEAQQEIEEEDDLGDLW